MGKVNKREKVFSKKGRRDFLKTAIAGMTIAVMAPATVLSGQGDEKRKRFGMIIDLKRCIACRACIVACKQENKMPPGVAYNLFIEEEHGEFPYVSRTYFTRPCMQCRKSSCAQVCPVGATYKRSDGIVAINYDRCIGCRYCIAACPYGARSFDYGYDYFKEGDNPFNQMPSPEYGENRLRKKGKSPIGNVRKCTFCLHKQDSDGNYTSPPACVETCMGRALHFGDLNDPGATCIAHGEKIQGFLPRRKHFRLKEELGNEPSVYYLT